MKVISSSANSIKSQNTQNTKAAQSDVVDKNIAKNKPSKQKIHQQFEGVDLKLNHNTKIKATISAILKDNIYSLNLENGTQINIKIDTPIPLKLDSQVFIYIKDAKITDIIPSNNIESLNFENSKSLVDFLKLIQIAKNSENLDNNIIKTIVENVENSKISLKILSLGNIILKTQDNSNINLKPNQALDLKLPDTNSDTIKLISDNKSLKNIDIKEITFTKENLPTIFNSLKSKSESSVILKLSEQLDSKNLILENANFQNIKVKLKANDTSISKIVEFVKNNDIILKKDSNTPVEQISIPNRNFSKIVPELKKSIEHNQIKQNNKNIIVNIDSKNKISVSNLDGLTLATTKTLQKGKWQIQLPTENINPSFNKKSNETLNLINDKSEVQNIPLKEIKLSLNNKINKYIMDSLNNENFKAIKTSESTIKIENENIRFSLNIPDSELANFDDLLIDLDENNNLIIRHKTNKDVLETNQEENINTHQTSSNHTENKTIIPKMHKNFIADTLILLKSIKTDKQTTEDNSPKEIITSFLQDILNSQEGIQHLSSKVNDESNWRFLTFPYINDNKEQEHGELLYSKQKNSQNEDVVNLSFKINFSKLGKTIIKLKLNNKNLNINILLSRHIDKELKEKLISFCNLQFKKSDFWGTVHVIKANNVNEPLLKSKKIGYSSRIVNIEV